ncbi:transposase [Streptomyces peucetius]|nr:hypothetical protein CGZ69_35270 [Streptomyces peucetius subsp. caesius ATCC 27952]
MSWRLFLPACWDTPEAAGRRERCRIPDGEHRPSRWQFALDTLDELAGTGLRPAVLVPDPGCGAKADFRRGLEDRHLAYVLQTKGAMTAHGEETVPHQPGYGGLGPKPLPGSDPLPDPGPPPTPHRHLDRHLPHLPTEPAMAALRHHRTKHYQRPWQVFGVGPAAQSHIMVDFVTLWVTTPSKWFERAH